MKKAILSIVIMTVLVALSSCQKKSSEKEILSFQFLNPDVTADIRSDGRIEAEMPYGTDLSNLTPIITISDKSTISPMSGEAMDFTNPVTYTVTAEDGSQSVYLAVVTKEKNNEKSILSFRFASLNIDAVIDEGTKEIEATVPFGTDVTALAPTILISDDASIDPASDVVTDFTWPVTYTVTAEDGSQTSYVVTIIVANPENLVLGVWGVEMLEYYNTDYAGNPIASSISSFLYDPYSTDNGIQMYFREDKTGETRDSAIDELWLDWNDETETYDTHIICPDTVLVSSYTYSYDDDQQLLYIHLVDPLNTYTLVITELTEDTFVYENAYGLNSVEKGYLKRVSDTPAKSGSHRSVRHPHKMPGALFGGR